VLSVASADAGAIEQHPITLDLLRHASAFSLPRFTAGCSRLYRPYVLLGLALMAVYAVSAGAYLAFVVYGYRAAEGRILILGWTFIAAISAALLVAWITVVNLVYLLLQISMAVERVGLAAGIRATGRFVRAEFRELARLFLVVVAVVAAATLASALAWSGVGLVAFVPLIGLAVLPLQLAALVDRGRLCGGVGLRGHVDLRRCRVRQFGRHEIDGRNPGARPGSSGGAARRRRRSGRAGDDRFAGHGRAVFRVEGAQLRSLPCDEN